MRKSKNPPETRKLPSSLPSSKKEYSQGSASSLLKSSDPSLVKKLEAEADEIYKTILLPINEKLVGPLPKSETITARPMVLLLGNHSSGKSTFINHILKAEIQKSGVAPTDDCFTLITSGAEDSDQDGPALVGDPDLGFSALRNKGGALISHINLKVRKNIALRNTILVDSPGMIDCPAVSTSRAQCSVSDTLRLNQQSKMEKAPKVFDRGYDFMDVIKWFCEHSDVILLFFDPDKPGTTGETLECLTTALSGMEHKILIIFNKCDQFTKIHDFARAFGALCWNLSKVIPRKDLPPIYTMCVPVEGIESTGLGSVALADLAATRMEVIQKIHNAPERRVDNMITRLDDATRVLQMYTWVCSAVRSRLRAAWWGVHGRAGLLCALAAGVATAAYAGRMDLAVRLGSSRYQSLYIPLAAGGQILALTYYALELPRLGRARRALTEDTALNEILRERYRMEIADGDQYLLSLWVRVRARVKEAMAARGEGVLGPVTRRETEALERVLREDVPRLRRLFARAVGDGKALDLAL